jgi:CheY-like chemotaxis protein
LNGDQAEFVDIANTSAHRLMHLLDDILDFSKIEAGKVTLENIPIDLRSIVSEVHGTFKTPAAKKQVELREKIDPAVPARVLGDPTRLRQILSNLVGNAVKFTHQGAVTIELRSVAAAHGRTRLKFEVTDTGIGIAEAQVETIFNSFMQADNSMTRRYGGTGLGLAICQQLVALMGGQIDVYSVPGAGSTFGFTLTMTVVTLNDPLPASAMLTHLQALIVDEENTARYVLGQQLRRWGVSVIETTTLDHARTFLESAAHRNEELNIVFLRSPDVSALTWVREMRKQLRHVAPRFILIAERTPEESSGYDGVLLRPIRLSDLYNLVINSGLLDDVAVPPEGDGFMTVPQAGRILLAEDDVMNWKIVVRALSQMGYMVDVAHDGEEALALVQQNDYALILMDVHMPVIDGLEATKRIRAMHPPRNKVPVVAFTASVLTDEQQKYFDVGMNAFLAKPFSIEQLRDTVYRWAIVSGGS